MSEGVLDLLSSAIRSSVEPEKLLETYIPGFVALQEFFSKWFRINLTKVLKLGFLCVLYMTAGRSVVAQLYEHFLGYLTSTISIQRSDPVNKEVLTWMADHIAKQNNRFLTLQSAGSDQKSRYGSDYVSSTDKSALREALGLAGSLDMKRRAVTYFPAMGKIYFLFEGRPFIFYLIQERYSYDKFHAVPTGEEPILIRCLGRNPAPLKRFVEHCREHSLKSKQSLTTIYTTQPEKYSERLEWKEATVRPVRPLSTVDLAEGIKQEILKDVERYHHPSTRLFYARRGVPYRRGYLLYGPPGTGKTSFSLALAGHFQIDLYMVSLTSMQLTDEGLSRLFDCLPPKCIVLLEDVDSAGIERENSKTEEDTDKVKKKRKKPQVTLSGLLNTIDGAASQEGRLLIMTSNTPETLDPALIRHGRVDKQIKFDYIQRSNAKQLFIRMFSMHADERMVATVPSVAEDKISFEVMDVIPELHGQELEELAEEFANKLPDRMLSPAEVQGFLLDHRDKAREAVANASNWVIKTLRARNIEVEKKEREGRTNFTQATSSGASPLRSRSQ